MDYLSIAAGCPGLQARSRGRRATGFPHAASILNTYSLSICYALTNRNTHRYLLSLAHRDRFPLPFTHTHSFSHPYPASIFYTSPADSHAHPHATAARTADGGFRGVMENGE